MRRTKHALPLLALVGLLALLGACRQTAPALPSDPRQLHAREASAWREWDAQLESLYRARRGMREHFLLGEAPPRESHLEEAAWAAVQASERSTLAGMIAQEASCDATHCRQALELAEAQEARADREATQALVELQPAVAALRDALQEGDLDENLDLLERWARDLPPTYRDVLRSVGETLVGAR